MEYFVYVVQSQKDNKYYIGFTGNLTRRLSEHQSGNTRSLRSRLPLKLVYTECCSSKQAAMAREKQIKAYKGGDAFKALLHGAVPEWSNG